MIATVKFVICFAFALIIWQVIIRPKHKSIDFLALVICLMKTSSLILIMKFHTRSNCNRNHFGISLTLSLLYYWVLYCLQIIYIHINRIEVHEWNYMSPLDSMINNMHESLSGEIESTHVAWPLCNKRTSFRKENCFLQKKDDKLHSFVYA